MIIRSYRNMTSRKLGADALTSKQPYSKQSATLASTSIQACKHVKTHSEQLYRDSVLSASSQHSLDPNQASKLAKPEGR